ncbi:MAG: protein kinase [Colwellia sp.]|nr:protein kinase [Colwellia sp.]
MNVNTKRPGGRISNSRKSLRDAIETEDINDLNWYKQHNTFPSKDDVNTGAANGCIKFFQWISTDIPHIISQIDHETMNIAAQAGYDNILQWGSIQTPPINFNRIGMRLAVKFGRINVLVWSANSEQRLLPGNWAMNSCCCDDGNIEIIEWGASLTPKMLPDEWGMNLAAESGNIDIISWGLAQTPKICINAHGLAVLQGNLFDNSGSIVGIRNTVLNLYELNGITSFNANYRKIPMKYKSANAKNDPSKTPPRRSNIFSPKTRLPLPKPPGIISKQRQPVKNPVDHKLASRGLNKIIPLKSPLERERRISRSISPNSSMRRVRDVDIIAAKTKKIALRLNKKQDVVIESQPPEELVSVSDTSIETVCFSKQSNIITNTLQYLLDSDNNINNEFRTVFSSEKNNSINTKQFCDLTPKTAQSDETPTELVVVESEKCESTEIILCNDSDLRASMNSWISVEDDCISPVPSDHVSEPDQPRTNEDLLLDFHFSNVDNMNYNLPANPPKLLKKKKSFKKNKAYLDIESFGESDNLPTKLPKLVKKKKSFKKNKAYVINDLDIESFGESDNFNLSPKNEYNLGEYDEENLTTYSMLFNSQSQKSNLEIDPDKISIGDVVGTSDFCIVSKAVFNHQPMIIKQISAVFHPTLNVYLPNDVDPVTLLNKKITMLKRETSILTRVYSPSIIRIYGIGTYPSNLFILYEYAEQGDLRNILNDSTKVITVIQKYEILKKIVNGMLILHSNNILHHNLTSTNILIDCNWVAKISDFGLSHDFHQYNASHTDKGELQWLAPECIDTNIFTKACDVYSFGMIVYEILTNCYPWGDLADHEIIGNVKNGIRPTFINVDPVRNDSTDFFLNLIIMCWDQNPTNRPSFKDLDGIFEENKAVFSELSEVDELRLRLEKAEKQIIDTNNKNTTLLTRVNTEQNLFAKKLDTLTEASELAMEQRNAIYQSVNDEEEVVEYFSDSDL